MFLDQSGACVMGFCCNPNDNAKLRRVPSPVAGIDDCRLPVSVLFLSSIKSTILVESIPSNAVRCVHRYTSTPS
jgi:hypothetical protein